METAHSPSLATLIPTSKPLPTLLHPPRGPSHTSRKMLLDLLPTVPRRPPPRTSHQACSGILCVCVCVCVCVCSFSSLSFSKLRVSSLLSPHRDLQDVSVLLSAGKVQRDHLSFRPGLLLVQPDAAGCGPDRAGQRGWVKWVGRGRRREAWMSHPWGGRGRTLPHSSAPCRWGGGQGWSRVDLWVLLQRRQRSGRARGL